MEGPKELWGCDGLGRSAVPHQPSRLALIMWVTWLRSFGCHTGGEVVPGMAPPAVGDG